MPHQDFFRYCRPQSSRRERLHLQMYRGDTLEFKTFIFDGDDPVDITGGNFWFTVKQDMNDLDTSALIRKELNAGITIVNGPLGFVLITLDPDDTNSLNNEETVTYYWDLQYQDTNGVVRTVFIGKITVIAEVTRTGQATDTGLVSLIGIAVLGGTPFTAGVNAVVEGWLGQDEQQSIHVTGAIAGTFTLTVEDPSNLGNFETTGALNWNATQLEIETELELITFIDDVTMSGAANLSLGAIDVTFSGPIVTALDFPLMTMDVSLLS